MTTLREQVMLLISTNQPALKMVLLNTVIVFVTFFELVCHAKNTEDEVETLEASTDISHTVLEETSILPAEWKVDVTKEMFDDLLVTKHPQGFLHEFGRMAVHLLHGNIGEHLLRRYRRYTDDPSVNPTEPLVDPTLLPIPTECLTDNPKPLPTYCPTIDPEILPICDTNDPDETCLVKATIWTNSRYSIIIPTSAKTISFIKKTLSPATN